MKSRLLIFVNGLLPNLVAARRLVRPDDTILAVDGGTLHVLALGLMPGSIIGDLDSLPPAVRNRMESSRVPRLDFPRDKDETDLQLAIQHAVQQDFHEIVILAALGGRLDQTLANLALLADPALAHLDLRLDDGVEAAFFVRGTCRVSGATGDFVSLIPWGGQVTGVTTQGLRWSLDDETLLPCQTRGISNEMLAAQASVQVRSGLLLLVHRRNTLTG